jgi:acyl-CoA thioesterase II
MLPLLEQLTLQKIDDTHFVAPPSEETHIRSYGGQVVAQALLAAGMTVSGDRLCHSFHSYFLRPGSTKENAQLATNVVRDGRSFSMREVTTTQNDKEIFRLMASFHRDEEGPEHQSSMPSAPDPESLPTFAERFAGREGYDQVGRWFDRLEMFDLRFIGPTPLDVDAHQGRSQFWVRFSASLESALMHQVVLAYVSDMFVLDPILLTHNIGWTSHKVIGASLDHSIWFHRPVDTTQWLLFDQESSISASSRGTSGAHVWTQHGQLVASVAQEALIRPPYGSAQ